MGSFNKGDIVELKSGGPPMTVAQVEGERVLCQWFDGKSPAAQRFDAATLKISEGRSGPVPLKRG